MAAGSLRAARTPTAAVSLMCMTAAWRVRVGCFFFSSRRRHTSSLRDWSSDVCSSDRLLVLAVVVRRSTLLAYLDATGAARAASAAPEPAPEPAPGAHPGLAPGPGLAAGGGRRFPAVA